MRAGSAGIASPVGVGFGTGSGAFATAALPCAVNVCAGAAFENDGAFAFELAFAFAFDDEVEPQLDPVEAHGLDGATGGCFADEPQLGPFDGTLETGENVAGNDEIARGFVNGMTFADTR